VKKVVCPYLARESACEQVIKIGVDFISDWLTKKHEHFQPMTERCIEKSIQSQIAS